jgi:cytochrome c-type biogenesis protein CcmH
MMSKLTGLVLFVFLVTAVLALPAMAQENGVTDDEVNEIARDVYCPVCENTPLDVCQTKACADWRELIRTKLAEGQSKEQIFDYFGRQYGDGVLADPPQRGVSLIMLWILPVVLVLLGALLFSLVMRNLRTSAPVDGSTAVLVDAPPTQTKPPAPTARDDYLARIEDELGKKDE